jgi:hypothetical protein
MFETMTWVKGQSGNPNGRKPGTLTKLRQAQKADLQVDGLTPDTMGLEIVKAMAKIALDTKVPRPVRIQASNTVLPYCLPRLQVTAHVSRANGDFSRARTKEELLEMVRAELGENVVAVLRRMMDGLEKGDDMIDAEVMPQPSAAAEQRQSERAPEPELAKP